MKRKFLLLLMMLAFAIPTALAGEKTVTISRNEGIYDDGTGVYYCSKGGITMTFSSGLNNVNYLVEHQQVVFDIFSTNYVIKKIKFNCLDNTTDDNLDCFYWGPSTISEFTGAPYVATGTYTYSGYFGTWVGGSTPSKYVKFVTEAKPVRFGSVEITFDKEFGDIYEKVTDNSEIENGQTYVLVSQNASKALGKEDYYSSSENLTTFTSTPVTLLDNNNKVKVTDEVQLMKLEASGNSSRPWYIKVGDNYMRRRSSLSGSSSGAAYGQGYNLHTASTVTSYEQYFRVSISVTGNTNQNALIRFDHNSSETSGGKTFAIRHYNGGSLFRDMDYSSNNQYAANQRVYLYKPAQSYEVTTECIPSNGGYITLGDGILTDNQGKNWSQHFDNVTFFVGPTNGWGVGEVTLTDINSKAVTTLTPTSTSDFGNDYSFEMPANDVKITANFLQPYIIDTICNPNANAGVFNFLDGYTDFNGLHKSNEGKTVTFKPIAANGYTLNSVTYTNNGTTTTLTPDANGVYSFVMPGNDVTLTANFEEAHDLYLLGTANGETVWHPYGPKFTFDGANQVYYIDVYFKGDSLYNNGQGDPYGHFSLTTKIGSNDNDWGSLNGHRIFATDYDYWVENGGTYNDCFQTSTDKAFKIPAGVYRITVGKDLDWMSIAELTTLVFTPAGGDPNNPTVVDLNTEVLITSNLEQLVHDINPNESSHATFYNTTNNWDTNEHDNTRVIENYDVTTIIANVNLGYIKKEDNASYEVISDLYLLGTANGMDSWQPYGPQFTYDSNTETYSLDVYFTGLNVTAADEGYGYFSLSKVISDPQQPNWGDIPNSARINAENNDEPITGLGYNESTSKPLFQTDPNKCFMIDPGVYTITVNRKKNQMTVTKHELTLTFNPPTGTTVAAGDNVNISSNLDQLVHAINPDEQLHATIKYATSTDGTPQTPDTEGSTVTITEVDATTTVYAEAKLGYITVTDNADYIIPAPTVYSITTIVTPEGAGTITAPEGATAGTTVTFTVDTNNGYRLDEVQVTYGYSQTILEDISYDPATGVYSFVMPDDEVKIYADYTQSYDITTVVTPDGAGTITVPSKEFPSETVTFTVTANPDYEIGSVSVTSAGTNVSYIDNGDGTYSFTMPTASTQIYVEFVHVAVPNTLTFVSDPEDEGWFYGDIDDVEFDGDEMDLEFSDVETGAEVSFFVEPYDDDYRLDYVAYTVNGGDEVVLPGNGDGSYSFDMPEGNVTVIAHFKELYEITKFSSPNGAGTFTGSNPEYAAAGDVITFGVKANDGWIFLSKEVYSDDETIGDIVCPSLGIDADGYRRYQFTMPAGDVIINAYFERDEDYYEVTCVAVPASAGTVRSYSSGHFEDSFESGDEVSILVKPDYVGSIFNGQITAINETTDQPVQLDSIGIVNYFSGRWVEYRFTMPESDVTVTAYFDVNTPLQVIEHPDGPGSGKTVTVADQLIGTWAAKNYLWAKDQDPYVSNDMVERPDGTIDYMRQVMKLQKKAWDQSNWVILDFSTIPGWDGDYYDVADYVDRKIVAGSITGEYECERGLVDETIDDGNYFKAQNIIHLSELPRLVEDDTKGSLGYPGYLGDPREEDPTYKDKYMYNHYMPANFWQEYIGGKFGTVPETGAPAPNDPSVNLFFVNPKDREVAQVWGVWMGKMENGSDDVFEVYKPSASGDINVYNLAGAFLVPQDGGWSYNRKSSGNTNSDYGKPVGGTLELQKNTAYLFHAAIATQVGGQIPVKAPKRAEQENPEGANYTPWSHYMVYPLDMGGHEGNITAVQEIAAPASIEIESIRYYNIMGQESATPFDGINIRVIRYKDGSMISKKILK